MGGSATSNNRPLVAWKTLCRPKNQGGLGFHDVISANNAMLLKHLWALILKTDSLWVKWIHGVYLNEIDIWSVPLKCSQSWGLKKILNLRSLAVGIVEKEGAYYRWKASAPSFSSSAAYKALFPVFPKVGWCKLVWSKMNLPRHSMILWLAFHEKLQTRVFLRMRGLDIDTVCPLCTVAEESRDHLFFNCDFSERLWSKVCDYVYEHQVPSDWSVFISFAIRKWGSKGSKAQFLRATFAATVYMVWQARNEVVFRRANIDVEGVFQSILFYLKIQLHRIQKIADTVQNREWCRRLCISPQFVKC